MPRRGTARIAAVTGGALGTGLATALLLAARVRRSPEREVREGVLHGGLPYLSVGTGPPLVVLRGLSAEHANPRGAERWHQLRVVGPLTRHFTVHLVTPRPGIPADVAMADLAADVAAAIRHDLDGPVALEGISTGGAIAQQLAIDHPDVVSRLVLLASAYRLAPDGREAQRRLAEMVEHGRPRAGWAAVGPANAAGPVRGRLMGGMIWLAAPASQADDASDMLATIRAEDVFDVGDRLHRITAPTLVVAGERDRYYTPDLFRETARRIPDARLVLYPRRGHAGVLTHRPAQREIVRFLTGDDDGVAPSPGT